MLFVCLKCLGKQKRSFHSWKAWYRCEFWGGQGLATFALSLCMEITPRCQAFETSKTLSLLEFCSLQAVCTAGSWPPHCCLEHLKELSSWVLRSRQSLPCGFIESKRLYFALVLQKSPESWDVNAAGLGHHGFLPIMLQTGGTLMPLSIQEEVFLCNISGKQSCTKQSPFQGNALEGLGHSLLHKSPRNSILRLKTSRLIWMTK